MTMNPSDAQLIRQYAETADQQAFELLTERYIDLAYSAARSCLGRDDLARDACQLTFVELSKKADRLSDPARLGSWIYSTTRNLSRKIQRTETRRQQREQRYMDHQKIETAPEPDWSHLVPEIHSVLEQLKEADREAIILRYFQGKSLAEIGEILGVSADAVRMRVKRALEQLNSGLSRKGITSTAAALAAALPAHAALSAPTWLAASISSTVLAGAGTTIATTTLTGVIIAIMKAKTLIIAAATAVVVGGGVYIVTRSNESTISPKPATESHDSSSVSAGRNTTMPRLVQEMGISDRSMPSDNEIPVRETMDPPTDINPEQLKKAEQLISLIQFARPMLESHPDLGLGGIANKERESLAKKLELRLNMGEEQAMMFNKILAAHTKEQLQQLEVATEEINRKLSEFLDLDREITIPLLALNMMKDAGQAFTPEQEAFFQTYSEQYEIDWGQNSDTPNNDFEQWYDSEDVLSALEAQLDSAQQTELRTFIEEQKLREQEQKAYFRTNQLANDLGLNEADRAALYDYLYENPDATNEDIKELLTPELRELLGK